MSKYPPPVGNLPIFDPSDFNTTLNNGTPITYINSQIETQQVQTAEISTTETKLFTLSDLGSTPVYNTNYSIFDSATKNTNTEYIYYLGGDGSSLYPAGTYLCTCSVSIQTTVNVLTSSIQVADSNGFQSYIYYAESYAVGSFDMNASFILQLTTPTNLILRLYVTSFPTGTYKINTTGGNLINTSVIKLK